MKLILKNVVCRVHIQSITRDIQKWQIIWDRQDSRGKELHSETVYKFILHFEAVCATRVVFLNQSHFLVIN